MDRWYEDEVGVRKDREDGNTPGGIRKIQLYVAVRKDREDGNPDREAVMDYAQHVAVRKDREDGNRSR